MDKEPFTNFLKLIILCLLWYMSSSGGNIIGKLIINEFPYPMTLTMVQLSSSAIYLGPILRFLGVPSSGHISRKHYYTYIIPLSLGKFFASVSSLISISKVSVSYAHTVKASLPLFTVILSRIFLGEKQTLPIYLSLIPIIGGVIIATLTEVSFDLIGLISALSATLGFSLQTIFSKKCLKESGLHSMRLLLSLSRISAICFIPIWLIMDVKSILSSQHINERNDFSKTLILMLIDGLLSMLQSVFAFSVLAMVAPLSYAVANASKRIVIISTSLILLRNPVTATNVIGMSIACFGVIFYNKAKYDQNQAKLRAQTLPLVHSESDLKALKHNSHIFHQNGMTHSKSVANFGNADSLPSNHILLSNYVHHSQVQLLPAKPVSTLSSQQRDSDNVHARIRVY